MVERGKPLMAHCPECGEELSAKARFCPRCGAPRQKARQSSEQLPLIGFGPGTPALQPAGAGLALPTLPGEAAAGKPLTAKQVAIAIGAVMLALIGILYYAGYRPFAGRATGGDVPVMGVVGEPIYVGKTAVGVADIGTTQVWEGRSSENGQFLAVIIIIGNYGGRAFTLDNKSFALTDAGNGGHHAPSFIAYGMPEELQAGRYQSEFQLTPEQMIAAVAVFDIATSNEQPRLLVRDLTRSGKNFTGAIDLTRHTNQQQMETPHPGQGVLPLFEWKVGWAAEWMLG